MSSRFNFKNFRHHFRARGFTVLELMVVLTIFTIMTGVVLANLPQFRDQAALQLIAEDVALAIRQAQVYGGATRGLQSTTGTDFYTYGLVFNINNGGMGGGGATDKSFVMFTDRLAGFDIVTGPFLPNNNQYNFGTTPAGTCGGPTTECVEISQLTGAVKIQELYQCATPSTCIVKPGSKGFNIMFHRPGPDAQFYSLNANLISPAPICVKIRIASTRNLSSAKDVVIWSTGHIYTQDVPDAASPGQCS